MKNNLHEFSEQERRQAAEELMLPAAEFLAMFAAAVLLLGFVFAVVSPTLPTI
jgi:hypothetical protein